MRPAKYLPKRPCGSGKEIVRMAFIIYNHGDFFEFRIMTF